MSIFHKHSSLIRYFISNGYQISKNAIEYIISESIDPGDLISYLSTKQPQLIVITEELCAKYKKRRMEDTHERSNADEIIIQEISSIRNTRGGKSLLAPIELAIISPISGTQGKIVDFTFHHKDRCKKLSDILIKNFKLNNADSKLEILTDFSQFHREEQLIDKKYLEVCFVAVGMISDVREYRDSIFVYLQGEGNPGVIAAKCPKKSNLEEKIREFPLGMIIGVKGKLLSSNKRIIKNNIPLISIDAFFYPDTVRKSSDESNSRDTKQLILPISNTSLVGDINNEEICERSSKFKILINSINEFNNTHSKETISTLLISGNFANTECSDHAISDNYRALVDIIEETRSSSSIIIIPGEQDFTRKIFPKPRPHRKYLPDKTTKVYFFDNPACFSLAGRIITVYYDRSSMEDIEQGERVDYMVKLLRFRHLNPKWTNMSTPTLSSSADQMMMLIQPDIFIFGSADNIVTGRYKSTKLVIPIDFDCIFEELNREKREIILNLTAVDLNSLEDYRVKLKINGSDKTDCVEQKE